MRTRPNIWSSPRHFELDMETKNFLPYSARFGLHVDGGLELLSRYEDKPAKRNKTAGLRAPRQWGKFRVRLQPTILGHTFTFNVMWDGGQINPWEEDKWINWKGEVVGKRSELRNDHGGITIPPNE